MRTLDYARLGLRNIGAHKKRVLMVVVIVGVLFGVLMAVCMLFAGIKHQVLSAQTEATNGRVLLFTVVDEKMCGEEMECDYAVAVAEMREVIKKYNGEVVEGNVYHTSAGVFYEVPEGVIKVDNQGLPVSDVPVVAVSMSTAQRWLRMSDNGWNGDMAKRAKFAESIRKRSLHQAITYQGLVYPGTEMETEENEKSEEEGEKYYIADLLPPGGGASTLGLDGPLKALNPLNLVFGVLNVGYGENFVLRPNQEMLAGKKTMAEEGRLIASFADIETAIQFTKDPATRCRAEQVMFNSCPAEYKFATSPVMLNPLENYEVLSQLETVLNVFIVIFCVVAVVVTLTTFVRLIRADTKTIALYYALGASKHEVLLIYLVYLLGICVITVGFVWLLGLALTLLTNLLNATGLSQVFMLAYGGAMRRIWLIDLSPAMFWISALILKMAPVAILLSFTAFNNKNVMKVMK